MFIQKLIIECTFINYKYDFYKLQKHHKEFIIISINSITETYFKVNQRIFK